MGFSLSPSVTVTEKDLTLYIPNVAVSIGALVGFAEWGPVEEVITTSSEKTHVGIFGQPDENNLKDWFTAYNFLAYSSNLKFVRVGDDAVADELKNKLENIYVNPNMLIVEKNRKTSKKSRLI